MQRLPNKRHRSAGSIAHSAWLWPALLLLSAACAFPQIGYLDDNGGGVGGGSTNSSSSTTTSGNGGAPACVIGSSQCGDDMKCSVVDLQTGAAGCIVAGNTNWWHPCSLDSDCISGAFCDLARKVCKPFCTTSNDCQFSGGQFEGACRELLDQQGNPVPGGHQLCVPNCDPKTAAPCATSQFATCINIGSGRFDCAETENKTEGSSCTDNAECGGGLTCETGNCRRWCTPVGMPSVDCQNVANCQALNPPASYDDVPHGACPAP